MTNLPNWPVLLSLPSQHVKHVSNVYVFGSNGDEVLYAASSSDAKNSTDICQLDIYQLKSGSESVKIGTFNGKNFAIIDVKISSNGTFLLLTNTCLYAWGNNSQGQVGNGQTGGTVDQPFIVSEYPNLKDEKIVQVAAGIYHSVCLTESGRIYAWGSNQYGQVGPNDGERPTYVNHEILKEKKIISVQCTELTTFALDSEGGLLGFGYNGDCVLGMFSSSTLRIGGEGVFKDVFIKEIACGSNHVLALTPGGTAFSWGANGHGQLGLKHTNSIVEPTRIAAFDNPRVQIDSILACNTKRISVARSIAGETFVWGETRMGNLTVPTKVPAASAFVAFFDWIVLPFVFPSLVKVENMQLLGQKTSGPTWLRQSFDNSQTSDIKIVVQGRLINVHKSFLTARSTFFRKMFSDDHWREAKEGEVTIQHYDVYRTLLYYLYTDEVDIPGDMDANDVLSLYDLADSYFEDELKGKVCDFFLKKWLNLDNVIAMYGLAADHSVEQLASACLELILENLSTLVKSEAFAKLDSKHAKNIFLMSASRNLLKS